MTPPPPDDLFEHAATRAPGSGRPGGARTTTEEDAFEGTIERLVFSGRGGEFTVARLAVEGRAEPVTVVGSLLGVPAGARLRLRGRFETTARFGIQFRVSNYTEVAPETVEGIRRYLGSGLVKGIGPEMAARIVAKFGIRTLEILDARPHRIGEVSGIGPSRVRAIREAWSTQRDKQKVMVFLQGHGVSPAFAARIFKRYGAEAVAIVRANPYRLASDVWGMGFLSADRVAGTLGVTRDSDVRVEAGVRHELGEAAGDGHLYLPRDRLVDAAARRLEVPAALVEAAIERLAARRDVVVEPEGGDEHDGAGDAVYDVALHAAEQAVATGLRRLVARRARSSAKDVDAEMARYQKEARIALAPEQADAVKQALTEAVLVITGGPGVGKTTIVRGIVAILSRRRQTVLLGAPTGRAAKRLQEATGQPAATLHRLLEWRPADGSFGRNRARPLEGDLVVVDEASMIDVRLAASLMAALPDRARLVLVGDVDQLPPVGPGSVLRDAIDSGKVPTVRLKHIFRQAQQSLIVTNAHRIHDGKAPDLGVPAPGGASADTRDFFFLEEDDAERAALVIRELVARRLPRRYRLRPADIQVLVPMHRGELGAERLNQLLQDALTTGAPELRSGGRLFRVGDRVMQVKNDYDRDVYNGDIGRVESVSQADGEMCVRFDDRAVACAADQLDELVLAYATTIHKAQGSEFPAVVLPIHTQHFVMLARNLLYTAVTRGKRLVVLVGSKKALAIALGNARQAARHSRLARLLQIPAPPPPSAQSRA